jgi:hypothetical protein
MTGMGIVIITMRRRRRRRMKKLWLVNVRISLHSLLPSLLTESTTFSWICSEKVQ